MSGTGGNANGGTVIVKKYQRRPAVCLPAPEAIYSLLVPRVDAKAIT
jgi:hypothetical protein